MTFGCDFLLVSSLQWKWKFCILHYFTRNLLKKYVEKLWTSVLIFESLGFRNFCIKDIKISKYLNTLKMYGCILQYKAQRFDTWATMSGCTRTIVSADSYSIFDQVLRGNCGLDKFSFRWCNIDFLLPIFILLEGLLFPYILEKHFKYQLKRTRREFSIFFGFSRKRKVLIST